MVSFRGVAKAFVVLWSVQMQGNGGYSSGSLEFAHNKNIRFKECYDAPEPPTANCTSIRLSRNDTSIYSFEEHNVG